jgi:hypothetical protein
VPEVKGQTADFLAEGFNENYEIKTLDMSGGIYAYPTITEAGRVSRQEALERAKTHGVGIGVSTINPHGAAKSWLEVMQRVMRQIGRNIKQGQFEEKPTVLVVALPRTSVRSDAIELVEARRDPSLGRVNGHLWTIAAHKVGDHFWWPDPKGLSSPVAADGNDNGPLEQNGVLRDYPFVRALLFIGAIWDKLGSADFFNPNILREAYRLHGVWNDAFTPLGQTESMHRSSFFRLCDAEVRMG